MTEITIDDFKNVELRVAEIEKVEEIEGASKLYRLIVNLGGDEKRQIVAGIKVHYNKEELIGKKVVIVANLEPRELRGVLSHGMVLAAPWHDIDGSTKMGLLTVDRVTPNGVTVS
jgi:methionyl-tRNA synthetase